MPDSTERITVALADDHKFITAAVRHALSGDSTIEIVGEANNGLAAQQLCKEARPDIIVLDLQLGDPVSNPTAWETLKYLREYCPDTKVIVLTAYSDDAYILGVLSESIPGYVLKEEVPSVILQAVHAVRQGGSWYSRQVMEKLITYRQSGAAVMTKKPEGEAYGASLHDLTKRDLILLGLIARGWDSDKIASEMGIGSQTVRNYASKLYHKIDVASRGEAIVWAREHGLGDISKGH